MISITNMVKEKLGEEVYCLQENEKCGEQVYMFGNEQTQGCPYANLFDIDQHKHNWCERYNDYVNFNECDICIVTTRRKAKKAE